MIKRIAFLALILILIAVVGVALVVTRNAAFSLVRPSHSPITRQPESVGIFDYQSVTFPSSDGLTLRGWWVPSTNGAVVIFVHGHAGNRQNQLDDAEILVSAGYGALLFDLRNNGESDGDLTTFGLYEVDDVMAALEFVKSQPGVDPARIGVLGQSMGGATALLAAAQSPDIKAVAALSAYTSMEDNIKTGVERLAGLPVFPFAPMVIFWGQWESGIDITQVRPIDIISSISPRPVLIVHGERDGLIPVENGKALYEAANDPKQLYLVSNAGHESFLPKAGVAYAEMLIDFFNQYLLSNMSP
jgi:uncharacterized protein